MTTTPELLALQDVCRLVAIEDLILSRLEWSRVSRSEQQRSDVKQLLDAPLDRGCLQDWATRLGLRGLLAEAGHG